MVLKYYAKLNETDISIWEFIVDDYETAAKMGLEEIAKHCNVSRTTVSRFVRKIGLSGFSEFKVRLGMETNRYDNSLYKEDHFEAVTDSMIHYLETQKNKNYDPICELIYNANNVFSYGSGDIQYEVSTQLKRMFLSKEKLIYNIDGVTFDEATFNVLKHNDVVILISLSGNSDEILEIARRLKLRGIRIISITEFKDNLLTQISDESLYINSMDLTIFDTRVPFKTTMLYFVLIELLFIKYCVYVNKANSE